MINKKTQEVFLSRKLNRLAHHLGVFNNVNVTKSKSRKHFDIILDTKLKFEKHIKWVAIKKNKTFGLLHKLQNVF